MSILVTGATGFLGGRISRRLVNAGYNVIALGRNTERLGYLKTFGAKPVSYDLSKSTACMPQIGDVDVVVHCAALSSLWGRYRDFEAANITGTKTAIELARQNGARRFVHISSPSIYFRFAHQMNVTEHQPLPRPINAYAATKIVSEKLVLEAPDLDAVILRPRGIYGAGDVALLPRLIEAAKHKPLPRLNEGQTVTDLTHVDDVVSATIAAIKVAPGLKQRVFNISGGEALNVYDVAERAADCAGVAVRWRSVPTFIALSYARMLEAISKARRGRPEPLITAYGLGLFAYSQTLDISAAKRELGWSPQIDFDTGLSKTFGQTICS